MKYYGIYKGVEIYTNDLDPDKYYQFSNNEYSEIIIEQKALIKDKFWSKEYIENKYNESHRYSIDNIRFELRCHTTIPKNVLLKNKTDFILNIRQDCSKIVLNKNSKHTESYKTIYDVDQRLKILEYIKSNNYQALIVDNISNRCGLYQFSLTNDIYITKHISGYDVVDYDKMVSDMYEYYNKEKKIYDSISFKDFPIIKLLDNNSIRTNGDSTWCTNNEVDINFYKSFIIREDDYFNYIVSLKDVDFYIVREMVGHFSIYKCSLVSYNFHNLEIVIFIYDQICSVYNCMGIDVLNEVDRIERKLKIEKLLWI